MHIRPPYLMFLGDAHDSLAAKVAQGVRHWRPSWCLGQLRLAGCQADLDLPDMDVATARAAGCETLLVGVANRGGTIPAAWHEVLLQAAAEGLDIASGLHESLADVPGLDAAARASNVRLFDVRHVSDTLAVATDTPRSGKRLLTVGSDCSVGKMFTSLAIEDALRKSGHNADFRATGQTGIFIAGAGISVDGVIADFISGAAEALSPANDPQHWDVIEGQGAIHHLSFSGVTLGLLHGSCPDVLVLCHTAGRTHMRGLPQTPLPSLHSCVRAYESLGRIANPQCRVAGLSINTSAIADAAAAKSYLMEQEQSLGLPATDPVRFGVDALVAAILS